MKDYFLQFTLLSDATFGRGDGLAGLLDTEVQHDAYGLPYLGGRTLKGLLAAECADIVFALERASPSQRKRWRVAQGRLFGRIGSKLDGKAILSVGAARLPEDLRHKVAEDVRNETYTPGEVLEMVTALRRQTAMDVRSGAPLEDSLRTMRVVLRGTVFEAPLYFREEPSPDDLALLGACVKAFRRAGIARNRGRGRLSAKLYDKARQDVTELLFADFQKAVSA